MGDSNPEFKKSSLMRLTGFKAKLVSSVATSWFPSFFVSQMKKQIGWRDFVSKQIDDEPTFAPLYEKWEEEEGKKDENAEKLLNKETGKVYKSISDYHDAYINKIKTPLEVAKSLIEFSKKNEIKELNAIVEMHEDEILKDAEESTERFERGTHLSIVDGVPFFAKEEFSVSGYTSKYGTTHINNLALESSANVETLKKNGAIFCGLTNMVALGSNPVGFNASPDRPSCRNPWNKDYYCGGSSSGSAAVVAAGLAPFALAVDGLGSIRSPASICGLVGFKPTFGRVTQKNMLYQDSVFSHNGPITNCVRDAAIVYSFIAGRDNSYIYGNNQPNVKLPNLIPNDRKYKIGICSSYAKTAIEPSYTTYLSFRDFLMNNGHEIVELTFSELGDCYSASAIHICAISYNSYISKGFSKFTNIDDKGAVITLLLGKSLSDLEIENCCRQRTRAIKMMEEIFEQVDFILLPTLSGIGEKIKSGDETYGIIDHGVVSRHSQFMFLGNLTGVPCITLNASFDEESHLPVGMQIISKWWTEDKLLDFAYQIESDLSLSRQPDVYVNLL